MVDLVLAGSTESMYYSTNGASYALPSELPDATFGNITCMFQHDNATLGNRLYIGTTTGAYIDNTTPSYPLTCTDASTFTQIFGITDAVNDIIVTSTGIHIATDAGLYVGSLDLTAVTHYSIASGVLPTNRIRRIRNIGTRYFAGFADIGSSFTLFYNDNIGTNVWSSIAKSGSFGDISDLHITGNFVFAVSADNTTADGNRILYTSDGTTATQTTGWHLSSPITTDGTTYPTKNCITTTDFTGPVTKTIFVGGEQLYRLAYTDISYEPNIRVINHNCGTLVSAPATWTDPATGIKTLLYDSDTDTLYAGAEGPSDPLSAAMSPAFKIVPYQVSLLSVQDPANFATESAFIGLFKTPEGSSRSVYSLARCQITPEHSIASVGDFISIGEAWTDGSGNVELTSDITLNPSDINGKHLFADFNAHFNFGGHMITLESSTSPAKELINRSIIDGLDQGNLYNLDLSAAYIETDASVGILVGSGGSGDSGTICDVTITLNECALTQPSNCLVLSKHFGQNLSALHHSLLSNISITGSNIACPSGGGYNEGILGWGMFWNTHSSCLVQITGITNTFDIDQSFQCIFGEQFGDDTAAGTFFIRDCSNSGTIHNDAGLWTGQGSLITKGLNGFVGHFFMEDCVNHGGLGGTSTSGGGLLGYYVGRSCSGTMVISRCVNNGNLNGGGVGHQGGIAGWRFGFQLAGTGRIRVENCVNSGAINSANSGGIVGYELGELSAIDTNIDISGCTNTGSFGAQDVGGIIGGRCGRDASGGIVVEYCQNTADISQNNAGGIVGYQCSYQQNTGGETTMSRCANSGAITGNNCGGIVGSRCGQEAHGSIEIFDCLSWGTISGVNAGGIVGYECGYLADGSLNIISCNNSGDIGATGCGGIAAALLGCESKPNASIDVSGCTNTGSFGAQGVGGIVGSQCGQDASGTIQVLICQNVSDVSQNNAGGIVGYQCSYQQNTGGKTTIGGCINSGAITGNNCGGIVGSRSGQEAHGSIEIIECSNSGTISGVNAGGIVGYECGYLADGSLDIISCNNSGNIDATGCGGIAAALLGYESKLIASVDVSGCTNTGSFGAQGVGGIVGSQCGQDASGGIVVEYCQNTADISQNNAGGIVGYQCSYQQNTGGETTIGGCTNSGAITGNNCGGIAGSRFGQEANGSIGIFDCSNSGTISGVNAGGIVGYECGYLLTLHALLVIVSCNNSGNIDATGCGGIAAALLGRESASGGAIGVLALDVSGCTNTGSFGAQGVGGIVGSQCGQDSSGTIRVTYCQNTADVSQNNAGGIAGYQFGYGQTYGWAGIGWCTNNGAITGNNCGGIAGSRCGQEAEEDVEIAFCINTGQVSGQYSAGIVADILSANAFLGIWGCTSSAINHAEDFNDGTQDCAAIVYAVGDTSSNIWIVDNTSTLKAINGTNLSGCVGVISDMSGITIDISDNTVTNVSLANCSACSGILNNLYNVQDCSLNIIDNTVTITNVSDTCSSIGGIMCIDTTNTTPTERTFIDVVDISLNISNNRVDATHIPNMFQHQGNATIFGTNTDIDPTAKPYDVSGTLVVMNNTISASAAVKETFTHVSSLYIPVNFRPYILALNGYPDSNYWFDTIITDIPSDVIVVTTIINEDFEDINDALLRDIFTRSLAALVDQEWFPDFELYHRRVVAQRTDVRRKIVTRTEIPDG